jgi:hypothetical protein
MFTKPSPPKTVDVRPQEIVRELLSRTVVPTPQHALTPARERRITTLERQAPTIVHQAQQAGVEITYLGINPLFAETRLYPGIDTDWTLAPAMRPDDLVVPRPEREALERLAEADLHFPLIYVAHEVDKAETKSLLSADDTHVALDSQKAAEVIPDVPKPAEAVDLAKRLARVATKVLATMRQGAVVGGQAALAVAAAPFMVIGSLAVDPIIIGAIPAVTAEEGELAAWYVLARWEW